MKYSLTQISLADTTIVDGQLSQKFIVSIFQII